MFSHTWLGLTTFQRNVLESCRKVTDFKLLVLSYVFNVQIQGYFDIINPNLYIFCISFHKVLCTFILYFLNFFLPSSFPPFFFLFPLSFFSPSSSLSFSPPLPSYIIIDILPIPLPLIWYRNIWLYINMISTSMIESLCLYLVSHICLWVRKSINIIFGIVLIIKN